MTLKPLKTETMNTDKQLLEIALCGYMPYGLMINVKKSSYPTNEGVEVFKSIHCSYHPKFYQIKPILRPMSGLTREITQADYNDGKPFVPIVELARNTSNKEFGNKFDSDRPLIFDSEGGVSYTYDDVRYRFWFDGYQFKYQTKWKEFNDRRSNQIIGFDLMNKWKLNWRNLPAEMWVDVNTLETNPYA